MNFIKNQQEYPQTLVMEGIDKKHSMVKVRREKRMKSKEQWREKNGTAANQEDRDTTDKQNRLFK